MISGIEAANGLVTAHLPMGEAVTAEAIACYVMPHFDALLEELPTLSELPDPQQAIRLSARAAGMPLLLGRAPTMREIYDYTQGAVSGVPEISLSHFENGASLVVVGEAAARVSTPYAWSVIADQAAEATLHTHPRPDSRATEADLIRQQLPSDADLEGVRNLRNRAGAYIAHSLGITYYEPLYGLPTDLDPRDAFADYFWARNPGAVDMSDLHILDTFLDFAVDHGNVCIAPWASVPAAATIRELGA